MFEFTTGAEPNIVTVFANVYTTNCQMHTVVLMADTVYNIIKGEDVVCQYISLVIHQPYIEMGKQCLLSCRGACYE
jgi:hypothetical protein